MAITPLRESSSQTKPIRRMFSSRSVLLKPNPLDRWVRTMSPSSTSTLAPSSRKRRSSKAALVLLPAPDIPVSQIVKPLCAPDRAVLGKMNPAFLAGVFFPPPSPGSFLFAGLDGPRARRASDAGVSLGVQRMDGNAVLLGIGIDLLAGPIRKRADAQTPVDLFYFADARAGRRLLPAQSASPGAKFAQLVLQRVKLADIAAQVAILGALIKQIQPALRHHLVHLVGVRVYDLYSDAVVTVGNVDHLQGFVGQPSGVQGEDADLRRDARGHVQNRHLLFLKSGRNGEFAGVGGQSPTHDSGSRHGFKTGKIRQSDFRLRRVRAMCQTRQPMLAAPRPSRGPGCGCLRQIGRAAC